MAFQTTGALRADGLMRAFLAALVVTAFGIVSPAAVAQVKAPSKSQFKAPAKPGPAPTDNQADQLNEKWLSEHNKAEKAALAPSAPVTGSEDERTSSVPSMATVPGAGARTLVSGSVKFLNAKQAMAGFGTLVGGSGPNLKPLSEAFAGFTPGAAKIDLLEGHTADGASRLIYASLGEGKGRKSFWWFMPLDQPEGWFDETGKRLGGSALTDPKPDSRISSPFGTRRYYGRSSGGGFHNGIDYEGKVGEPIYAAADGVINHQGWYFQYGRTVKISHADNFETLYAHMSRFEASLGPGSTVKRGDVIGYVGSTGRSTGPHLHFSVIVDGQFVDPQAYVSPNGNSALSGQSLVAYRKWQQDVRTASEGKGSRSRRETSWTENPFAGHN